MHMPDFLPQFLLDDLFITNSNESVKLRRFSSLIDVRTNHSTTFFT